jgi:hypothetical protein
LGDIGLGLRVRNCNDGSRGCEIGNPRWSSVNSIYIKGIVWPLTGAPEILLVMVKAMRLIPAIGIPMRVVIWSVWIGLGAQGAKGQDKAHHQDNVQPSFQVHSLTLHKKKFVTWIC